VIKFIRAMYRGDIETARKISTEEFKQELAQNAKHYLMINKGDILFTCITNVAKNGNLYGVFVRLMILWTESLVITGGVLNL